MTVVHVVRGLYLLISAVVALTAVWRSWSTAHWHDRAEGLTFSAYALATAAAQGYAFSKPLTVGTLFIGVGVVAGAVWLLILAVRREGVR